MESLIMVDSHGKVVGDIMDGNQRQAVQWAYLAGLIDGEGSFVIQKTPVEKTSKFSKLKNDKYTPYFSIGMVDRRPLDIIQEFIGAGKVYEERVQNRRSIWRIRFGGRLVLMPFIKQILPFLIVKKDHAELLLKFCQEWREPYNKSLGIDEIELQRREESYQKMRKLNAVGAAATTKSFSERDLEAIV